MRLHLDFETRAICDLKVHGAKAYFQDPSFQILLTGWAVDDGPVTVDEGPPSPLVRDLLWDPGVSVHAFNAPFEIGTMRAYAVHVIPERVHCTMVDAYGHGFSGGLDDVGKQCGILHQKLPKVLKFSKPRRFSAKNPALFWEKEDDPETWAKFIEYCRQDVEAERDIYRFLRSVDPEPRQEERRLWVLDRQINDRGVPVDVRLVDNALLVDKRIKDKGEARFKELTGLTSGQRDAVMAWARERGYEGWDMQAETVRWALENGDLSPLCREALTLRQQLSQAATSKYQKIRDIAVDGRIHDTLQLRGAGRTGRWAGRGLQLQNLKRPIGLDVNAAVSTLRDFPDLFPLLYGLDDLGSLIRSAICASDGKKLVVADLANIESRVLGWLTGCYALNRVFEEDRDPYRDFGSIWLHKPESEITKAERNQSKPPALGCGYGLGAGGLVKYAESMGVTLTEDEAKDAVRAFRTSYPQIPATWRALDSAWAEVLATGKPIGVCRCILRLECPFLTIQLPSGRKLWYSNPLTIQLPSGRKLWYSNPEVNEEGASYMGQDAYTHQWTRIRTWGGKLIENITQAVACDVLEHGLMTADSEGLDIIGHVHDEILCEGSEEDLGPLVDAMTKRPSWAPDLILKAEGYVSERYRKG